MHPSAFAEHLRYEYPLTAESVVLDLGAHRGDFAFGINAKYGCNVNCYEPVIEFYEICRKRFSETDKVCVFKYGLAAEPGTKVFKVMGDRTGQFCTEGRDQEVLMLSLRDEMLSLGSPEVDLLKLNIEGGEYDLLESLVSTPLIEKFKNIQVQFHEIGPDWQARQAKLRTNLCHTHALDWYYPSIWESWKRA